MPITEIDHQKVKNRIKKIIETDPTLYDENNPKDKIRDIVVGVPPGDELADLNHPALVITNSPRWIQTRKRGSAEDGQLNSLDHIVNYDLFLIDQQSDSLEVEKSTDALWKKLLERLEQFANLRNPDDNLDPLAEESLPLRTERIAKFRGKDVDGFLQVLECLIISS